MQGTYSTYIIGEQYKVTRTTLRKGGVEGKQGQKRGRPAIWGGADLLPLKGGVYVSQARTYAAGRCPMRGAEEGNREKREEEKSVQGQHILLHYACMYNARQCAPVSYLHT